MGLITGIIQDGLKASGVLDFIDSLKAAELNALNVKYTRIAKDNADKNAKALSEKPVPIAEVRKILQQAGIGSLTATPPKPTYSYLSWNASTASGSTSTGDLGTTIQSKRLVFHVTKEVQHNFTSRVTQYPVEDGSDISDHVVIDNARFAVSALFSKASTPILEVAKPVGFVPDSTKNYTNLEQDCYDTLKRLRDDKVIVSLSSPLEFYDNLIITSLSIPKNYESGRNLHVDIELEQIRKVGLLIVKNTQKAKGKSVDKICTQKVDEGNKIPAQPAQIGSIFYTPELQAQIDAEWLKTITPRFNTGGGF